MRKDFDRRALRYGVLASLLAHLLVFALDPGFETVAPIARAPRLTLTPAPVPAIASGDQPTTAPRARTGVPVTRSGDDGSAGEDTVQTSRQDAVEGNATIASPLDRLRAPRDPFLWRAPESQPETPQQRAIRVTHERLAIAAGERPSAAERYRKLAEEKAAGQYTSSRRPGDVGFSIPFGRKPPPPARVIPAPPRIHALALDSISRQGEHLVAHSGAFSFSWPARLSAGQVFTLATHFPAGSDTARVHVLVDNQFRAAAPAADGVASVQLSIDHPGDHTVLVQFLGTPHGPAQLRHTIRVADS